MAEYREFETGATRDLDAGKLDYEGFFSPLVLRRRAEYMHKNRFQKDGSVRDGANWQKGIPLTAYAKSLARHYEDFRLHHRGHSDLAGEDLETALCAIMFNAEGYLYEILKSPEIRPKEKTPGTGEIEYGKDGFPDWKPFIDASIDIDRFPVPDKVSDFGTCPVCDGAKKVYHEIFGYESDCSRCQGTGKVSPAPGVSK